MAAPYNLPLTTDRQQGPYHGPPSWLYLGFAFLIGLIILGVVLSLLFGAGHWGPGAGFPFGWVWGLFSLLFLFWICSWFFRWTWWGPWGWRRYDRWGRWGASDSADQIARERYARGEITREQLDQIRRDLEQRPPGW